MGFESYRYSSLQLLVAGIWVHRGYHLPLPDGLPPEYEFLEEEDFAIVYPKGFDIEKFISELRKARAWLEQIFGLCRRGAIHGIVYREEDSPRWGVGFTLPAGIFGVVFHPSFSSNIIKTGIHELIHIFILDHDIQTKLDTFSPYWNIKEDEKYWLRRDIEEALAAALEAKYLKEPIEFFTRQRLSLRGELKERSDPTLLAGMLILAEKTTKASILQVTSQLLEVIINAKSQKDAREMIAQFFVSLLPRKFRKFLTEEHIAHGTWKYIVQPEG